MPKIVFRDFFAVHQESGIRCPRVSDGGTVSGLSNFQFVDVFFAGEFSDGGSLARVGMVFLRFE